MSWSMGISKDADPTERRRSPREALQDYVLLVFFGENNWGKLTDVSESGMSFEFSRAPSVRERVNFTFQAMGGMPLPRDEEALSESFEAAGKIVWVRDFERLAGVQFVDLAEASREQIRQLVSPERPRSAPAFGEEAKLEPGVFSPDPFAPPASQAEALCNPHLGGAALDSEETPGVAGKGPGELETKLPESSFDPSTPDDDRRRGADKHEKPGPTAHANPLLMRLAFMIISLCLAALAVAGGVKIIMTRGPHRTGAVEHPQDTTTGASEPAGAMNVSSAEAVRPFHVDVLDASGRRSTLWFARNGSGNGMKENPSKPLASRDFSASATKATRPKQTIRAEKPRARSIFALFGPKFSRPPAGGSEAESVRPAEDPAIPAEFAVPPPELAGDVLTSRAVPAPTAKPTGGMVQEAHLILSVPPVYPALARASRVSGDVVLDALIDARGHVATVKVISGPVLLQQAAVETLRQWKYKPAQLDGKPVAMHLAVTLKFRLN